MLLAATVVPLPAPDDFKVSVVADIYRNCPDLRAPCGAIVEIMVAVARATYEAENLHTRCEFGLLCTSASMGDDTLTRSTDASRSIRARTQAR